METKQMMRKALPSDVREYLEEVLEKVQGLDDELDPDILDELPLPREIKNAFILTAGHLFALRMRLEPYLWYETK